MKRVLLFGLGRTNKPLYDHLSKDPEVLLYLSSDSKEELRDYPRQQVMDPDELRVDFFDEIYCVPGVPPSHPVHSLGNALNEIEFSIGYFSSKVIGVTGTNGKSTLSKLLYDYLCSLGYHCVLAGNFGEPLCSFLEEASETDFIILELSSFQLNSLYTPFLDFAVLTSFEPDHLDWHGGLESYKKAKSRIFSLLKPGRLSLVPYDFSPAPEPSLTFSYTGGKGDYLLRGGDEILHGKEIYQLPRIDEALKPSFLLALAVLKEMGFDARSLLSFSFRGLEHRLEMVDEVFGVLYVNDSKSTTPGATLFALDRIPRERILLILGGKEKGADLQELFDGLEKRRSRIQKIFAYGEFSIHAKQLRQRGFEVEAWVGFEDTLEHLFREEDKGDCILLSPGFSSLDQLVSYEERGEKFKEFVRHL